MPPKADTGLAQRLDRLTRSVALVGFCGLAAMALLIFYDSAARHLSAPRIAGFADFPGVVFPIVIASCFPALLLRQGNVTVRFLGRIGGPRLNAALEAVAALITLAFFAILVWQFSRLVGNHHAGARTTVGIGMPLAPWWVVATAIMALCVPVQAYVACAWIRAAVTGQDSGLAALHDDEGISGMDTAG